MSPEYRFDHRGKVELPSTTHKRSLCWLYFILFMLLQAGVAIWLYLSGYLTPVNAEGGVQALSLRSKVDEQERLIAKQSATIVQLEARVAAVQRSESIQVTSNAALRDKLVLAETELVESRERLLLYEEVLSPAAGRGLNIQYLDINRSLIDAQGKKLTHDRHYQYHLILTNVRGDTALVEGKFNLTLQGNKQGKTLDLNLRDLVIGGQDGQLTPANTAFSFKHYQGLEGYIALPDGFRPKQVTVELIPVAGKKVTRQYDWNAFKAAETTTIK